MKRSHRSGKSAGLLGKAASREIKCKCGLGQNSSYIMSFLDS